MRFVFRADSSLQIGTGHVMRCLTLADELVGRGHETLFVCRDLAGNINALVRERGHECMELPAPSAKSESKSIYGSGLDHAEWLGVSLDTDARETIAALDGVSVPPKTAADISHAATAGRCATSQAALNMFCAMLGTVAGNAASGDSGGIWAENVTLDHTIVGRNTGGRGADCFGSFWSLGYNLIQESYGIVMEVGGEDTLFT